MNARENNSFRSILSTFPLKIFSRESKSLPITCFSHHPLKRMEICREIVTLTKLKNEPLYYWSEFFVYWKCLKGLINWSEPFLSRDGVLSLFFTIAGLFIAPWASLFSVTHKTKYKSK